MTDTTHDLALARAERDAWQSTCEELHKAERMLADATAQESAPTLRATAAKEHNRG